MISSITVSAFTSIIWLVWSITSNIILYHSYGHELFQMATRCSIPDKIVLIGIDLLEIYTYVKLHFSTFYLFFKKCNFKIYFVGYSAAYICRIYRYCKVDLALFGIKHHRICRTWYYTSFRFVITYNVLKFWLYLGSNIPGFEEPDTILPLDLSSPIKSWNFGSIWDQISQDL